MLELLYFLDLKDGKYDFELLNNENISEFLAGPIVQKKTTHKQKGLARTDKIFSFERKNQ